MESIYQKEKNRKIETKSKNKTQRIRKKWKASNPKSKGKDNKQ